MSIVTKVLILFLISLFLMLFVSHKSEQLTKETVESLLKERYIEVSDELFDAFADNDLDALHKRVASLNFEEVSDTAAYLSDTTALYSHETPLSKIEILQHDGKQLLLYMKYLDDDILLIDLSQNRYFKEIALLNYLILADIIILVILFLLILKMVYPLRRIAEKIRAFGEGDHHSRIEIVSDDEIAEVSKTFNTMASNLEALIRSREMLLRDIAHELKTPIAKSKFAVEMIEASKYRETLMNALTQMDELINDLLQLERLNAETSTLQYSTFSMETLVSSALSKLFIEEESLVEVKIVRDFKVEGDLNYLSIALKNLIDNALKYTTQSPVIIVAEGSELSVLSHGEPLQQPLEFYCEPFTQADDTRMDKGHGLGLSIVTRILQRHGLRLGYHHHDGVNHFSIEMG